MSTRATYSFFGGHLNRKTVTVYCHCDGYETGAAARFYQMLINPSKGSAATQFIRAVDDAEITDNHEVHCDTEYRYELEGLGPGALISVWKSVWVGNDKSKFRPIVEKVPLYEWIEKNSDLIDDFQPFKVVVVSYRARLLNQKIASDLLNGSGFECILRTLRVWSKSWRTIGANWDSLASDLRAIVEAFPELHTEEIDGFLQMTACQ